MGEEQFELLWIMPTQIAYFNWYFEAENSFVFRKNILEYVFDKISLKKKINRLKKNA